MKKNLVAAFIICNTTFTFARNEQNAVTHLSDTSTSSGEQFNLEGALQLFHLSKSPQNFEELINQEEHHVSNLDFNDDGMIDYLRIDDNLIGDEHIFVIQAVFGENQFQDIATIELSKKSKDSVIVQIVGDSELYMGSVILEPAKEIESNFKGPKGPSIESFIMGHVRLNVWLWPCVSFVYNPNYLVWQSPYYWESYPHFWKPRKRCFWKQHRWYCDNFHHYDVWFKRSLRIEAHLAYHRYYFGYRKSSYVHSNKRYRNESSAYPKFKTSQLNKVKSQHQGPQKGQKVQNRKGKV